MVFTRNAEATQQRLMEAALGLYAERGYAGTCLDAILKRAASSKGAFYHHFDSKEDLTTKALEGHWEGFFCALHSRWAQGDSPVDRIDALLTMLNPSGAESLRCPIGLLGFESRGLPERIRSSLALGFERWTELLTGFFVEAGLEPPTARRFAERLFLVYEGGVLLAHISGSSAPLQNALSAWREDMVRLLYTAPDTARGI